MKRYDEYKDTGIEWIPQIPKHWEEERAKYLFNKESRLISENDEIITCFRDGQVTLRKNRRTSGFTESFKEIGYQGIKKGDLVIHQMDAFAGAVGISDSDGKSTPVYIVCTPRKENVYSPYFALVIRQMGLNGYIQSLYRGIRERSSDFRFDVFKQLYLPLPPLEEQQAIVAYIEEKCKKTDALVEALEAEIEQLKEYKQSLIADCVTGKIKV
jgi:type I restriction enzyme S subunit